MNELARGLEGFVEQVGGEDHLVVEADDGVAGLDAGLLGGASGNNLHDLHDGQQVGRAGLDDQADGAGRRRAPRRGLPVREWAKACSPARACRPTGAAARASR